MSNSTLARIGIIEGEFKPGKSMSGGPCSDEREVSGVFGSECGDEVLADLSWDRVSETDDAVEAEVEWVTGQARGRGCSVRVGVSKGRKDWEGPLDSTVKPRPKGLGVALRDRAITSSRSARSTLVHMCFHISSDILGPGSPPPRSQRAGEEDKGLFCLLWGEVVTR